MAANKFQRTTIVVLVTFVAQCVAPAGSVGRSAVSVEWAREGKKGYLLLLTRHQGLPVLVDGREVGRISRQPIPLDPGTHKVVVQHPRRTNWLDENWSAHVRIDPGDTLKVQLLFKNSYAINSQPYDADVYLDGEFAGKTPLYFRLFENEVKYATVRKVGYEPVAFSVGDTSRRFFDLALVPLRPDTVTTPRGKRAEADKAESNTLLYAALTTMVVSGGLALYFRNEANRRFDRYQSTGDPEAIERLFAETQKYDRMAAAAFIVFQASVIASLYLGIKRVNR